MDPLNLTLHATLGDSGSPAADSGAAATTGDALCDPHSDPAAWRHLVAEIGAEISMPLTAALERIHTFTSTGRVDRAGLRALRIEIEQARHAGMVCQQLARLATGHVSQSHERVHLTHTLQSVLAHRSRELQARGAQVRQTLQPIEVIADAPLLFSLLNAVLDWSTTSSSGAIDLCIDTTAWPTRGRLSCRFAYHPIDQGSPTAATLAHGIDGLSWRLIEHTAHALGLVCRRRIDGAFVGLELEFVRTINPLLESASSAEQPEAFADSVNSKPLAGSHVLVVSARRDTRVQVREAIKHMGLVLDFVGSVEEAIEFCNEGLPHAIVIESMLKGPRFKSLAAGIVAEVPEFVFIEIDEPGLGADFQISSVSATGHARLSRDAIMSALPSALVYELSRVR